MNEKNLTPELQALLSELVDGKLTEDGQQKLCDVLRDSPEAQDAYCDFMALHALLHLDFSNGAVQLLPRVVQSSRTLPLEPDLSTLSGQIAMADAPQKGQGDLTSNLGRAIAAHWNQRSWRLAGAVAALAASLSFICWWHGMLQFDFGHDSNLVAATSDGPNEKPHGDVIAIESRPVAVLGQSSRAIWDEPNLPLDSGASLSPGKFKLNKGLVQLEFFSGASVIIEAPANFELVSPNRIICNLGKIRAHVPSQAIGFTITTPVYSAVDLGTEFTVQVQPTGESQFQVLEGKVDLRSDAKNDSVIVKQLTTGQTVRSAPSGELSRVMSPQATFVGTEQMLEMASAALRERYDSWKAFSRQIRSDPTLVFYYGFDGHQPWERVLRNEGPKQNAMLDGAIVGCQWTTGRWNDKQSLEFKRTTDRVRVNVPGEFESLTYAAWLRIEGVERWLSSLMLTDGHQPGEVHWQMTDQGQLMLGVKAEPDKSHDFYSPSVIGPKDLGRWVHLACVYNGKEGYVSHFLDGAEVSRESIRTPTKLRIGPAEIGNWVPQDLREYRIRSLNGRIDEFMLFSKPMTTKEIRVIYEAGRPHS